MSLTHTAASMKRFGRRSFPSRDMEQSGLHVRSFVLTKHRKSNSGNASPKAFTSCPSYA